VKPFVSPSNNPNQIDGMQIPFYFAMVAQRIIFLDNLMLLIMVYTFQ